MENKDKFKNFLEKSKNVLSLYKPCGISLTLEKIGAFDSVNREKTLNIVYGIHNTPFGNVLIAQCNKGITDLLFITSSENDAIKKLFKKWGKAVLTRDESRLEKLVQKTFQSKKKNDSFRIYLKGTDFQLKVWQALLNIPEGALVSYSDVAEYINHPVAFRAVGTAIGHNPIHYLIPCHRVIRNDGEIGGYAGGIARKQDILASELRS